MFLIGTIKPSRKEIKTFFFMGLFRVGELRANKIKPILFLYAVFFLAATKTLHKRKEKVNISTKVYCENLFSKYLNSYITQIV